MGAPKETGFFRTESGTILEMDLPLMESIQQRVTRGEIVRMMKTGKGDKERWVPYEADPPAEEPSAAEAELEALREQAAKLQADLDAVTKERDAAIGERDKATAKAAKLQADLDKAKAPTAK